MPVPFLVFGSLNLFDPFWKGVLGSNEEFTTKTQKALSQDAGLHSQQVVV